VADAAGAAALGCCSRPARLCRAPVYLASTPALCARPTPQVLVGPFRNVLPSDLARPGAMATASIPAKGGRRCCQLALVLCSHRQPPAAGSLASTAALGRPLQTPRGGAGGG
jgi:hypothetical protein